MKNAVAPSASTSCLASSPVAVSTITGIEAVAGSAFR